MSVFTLRCDLREIRSGIIAILKDHRQKNYIVPADTYEFIEEVLTVGDYTIECGKYILIIERKSIADLVASIKDRRIYENHKKLVDAASNTGAVFRIMYLIEGKKLTYTPNPYKVDGIFASSLASKLDHLMMVDGCQIEWTDNPKATAVRLLELGKNMMSIKQERKVDDDVEGGAIDVGAIVKKVYVRPVCDVQNDILMCVPGIGPQTAKKMLSNHSLRAIICDDDLNDETIPEKVKNEMIALRAGERSAVSRAMLIQIKGISADISAAVIAAYSIQRVADNININELSEVKRQNGKRLGTALATRIVNHFAIL